MHSFQAPASSMEQQQTLDFPPVVNTNIVNAAATQDARHEFDISPIPPNQVSTRSSPSIDALQHLVQHLSACKALFVIDIEAMDKELDQLSFDLTDTDMLQKDMEPLLQLIDPPIPALAVEKDKDYSTSIDEKIEIIEETNKVTSALLPKSVGMPEMQLPDSSASSVPPGFEIKGKYLLGSSDNDSLSTYSDIGSKNHEDFSAWKKQFGTKTGSYEVFQVPLDWVIVIPATLLTTAKFHWVKSFLKSPMWQIIRDGSNYKEGVNFYVPNACPVSVASLCIQDQNQKELEQPFSTPQGSGTAMEPEFPQMASSTSALHLKGKKRVEHQLWNLR